MTVKLTAIKQTPPETATWYAQRARELRVAGELARARDCERAVRRIARRCMSDLAKVGAA